MKKKIEEEHNIERIENPNERIEKHENDEENIK